MLLELFEQCLSGLHTWSETGGFDSADPGSLTRSGQQPASGTSIGAPAAAGSNPPGSDQRSPEHKSPRNDPSGKDIAQDVITSITIDASLDLAAQTAGRAGATGLLGTLFAIFGGAQQLAEGYMAIESSKGRGMGGGSQAAEEAMNAIAQEKENNRKLAEEWQRRHGRH